MAGMKVCCGMHDSSLAAILRRSAHFHSNSVKVPLATLTHNWEWLNTTQIMCRPQRSKSGGGFHEIPGWQRNRPGKETGLAKIPGRRCAWLAHGQQVSDMDTGSRRPKIAIIGGGPGGLMTAYRLEQRWAPQLDITLFEASNRLGGKIITRRFPQSDATYEAGADPATLAPRNCRRSALRAQ